MSLRFPNILRFLTACSLFLLSGMFSPPVFAAPMLAVVGGPESRSDIGTDLRGRIEYAMVPASTVDPERVWQASDAGFLTMPSGQRLAIPQGFMLLARMELESPIHRDPDYLQFPAVRLDRVRVWSRTTDKDPLWQMGEAGDHVPLSKWPIAGPFPSFELPGHSERVQLVLAIEHRGFLNVPIEWWPDEGFRASRIAHSYAFGGITGLALALVLVCGLAAALFRRIEFVALGGYTLLTAMSLTSSNGYAAIFLWPEWPAWNDPSKGFFNMVLVGLLLPLVSLVLRLDVHRPVWWTASWRWALAGFAYALLQVLVLPPEWRIGAGLVYVLATAGFALALALHGVIRGDAMSRLTLLAVLVFVLATMLGYADRFVFVNEISLHIAIAATRLGFVVLLLCVAVQRHRFGRDVLSRLVAGDNRDPLTGLHNRSGIREAVTRAILMADGAAKREVGVLVCDLRSLGTVRAELGDEICDRVLVRFAYVLQGCTRSEGAMLGRLGYGRFVAVVLRDGSKAGVQAVATRILSRMLAQTDLPDAVRELKLRVVMTRMSLADVRIDDIQTEVNRQIEEVPDTRSLRWL